MQRAASVVRLALSSIWHSQQNQYIMVSNTVVLGQRYIMLHLRQKHRVWIF
jgi:hypothetical protein